MSDRTTISLTAKAPHKQHSEHHVTSSGSGSSNSIVDSSGRVGIALSLPALLIHPKSRIISRIKSIKDADGASYGGSVHKEDVVVRGGGKRKQRRTANALLYGNPHVTRPSLIDFYPPIPSANHKFFAPAPPSKVFPRNLQLQSTQLPSPSPVSSYNGTFSYSIRGVKRQLRSGTRAEEIVRKVEKEVMDWLSIAPERYAEIGPARTRRIIDATLVVPSFDDAVGSPWTLNLEEVPAIIEFSKTSTALVYSIADAYTRYVVHQLVRYLNLISATKPTFVPSSNKELRLTHILRPRANESIMHYEAAANRAAVHDLSASEDVTTSDFGSGYGTNETGETTGDDFVDEEDDDRVSNVEEVSEDENEPEIDEDEEDADVFAGSRGLDGGDMDSAKSSDRESLSTDEDDGGGNDDEDENSDVDESNAAAPSQHTLLSASLPIGSTFFSTSQLSESPRTTPRPRPRASINNIDLATPLPSHITPSTPTPTRARASPSDRASRAIVPPPAPSPSYTARSTALASILSSSAPSRPRPMRDSVGGVLVTAATTAASDATILPVIESEAESSRSRTRAGDAAVQPASATRSQSVARGERRRKLTSGNWELPKMSFAEYLYG